jgi:nucleoside-diphosphate-sugar epimerase
MNVLVTGGTGYCGTWMHKTLPDNVWAMGIGHQDYLDWEWELFNWDAIVHLAPISPARVLAYSKEHKARVLFVSSGAVYEGQGKYADDKRAWEKECLESGVDCVIARLFATSGLPFQKNKALSIFIQAALKGEPIQIWGNGLTVRSYLYGEEVGKAFWRILLDGEGTYNVGSTIPYSMGEVAEMVASIVPAKIEYIEHEEMPTPIVYLPRELGEAEINVGLQEAIGRMIRNES